MNGEEKRMHCPDCRTTYRQGERHGCATSIYEEELRRVGLGSINVGVGPEQVAKELLDRAIRNSPPPLDDVGSEVSYMLDEKDPQRLPSSAAERKNIPIVRGLLDYFPLACAAVAELSHAATQQHHPDQPMHWDRAKSTDHADCCVRHLMDRGCFDGDGQRHSTKAAWRALALLQLELEEASISD